MRLIETDVLTDTNIATAVSIGSYTATVVGGVIVRVLVKGAAGNGDYIIYATLTKSAQEYQIVPITTAPVASGRTAFGFVSLAIPVDVDDILQVYIDGLAGDTSTPDTRVDFYEKDYLRPTVAGRTLDVAATGEAGLDFTNRLDTTGILPAVAAGASGGLPTLSAALTTSANVTYSAGVALTGRLAEVTDLPSAAPSAATNATAAAAAILATPANKLVTSESGMTNANVAQIAGEMDLVDSLALALGTGGLVEKLNSMLEAAELAYRFTAAALEEAVKAILVTPANKLATGAAGKVTPSGGTINSVISTISANVVQMNGDTDPVDNLVLALRNSDGITAHPQGIADAVNNLAPASTPAVGSIGDHLDDLATALAAATSTLTVVSAVDGDVITIYQAVSFQATISGLAIPADWTKVYWTVKRATSEADTDAILQLVETNPAAGTDGLLRVNGAAGTAANGTLTVNQAAGTVVIDLVMTICDDLALATGLVWSLKALHPTSAATLLATGTVNVLGQATMAVA